MRGKYLSPWFIFALGVFASGCAVDEHPDSSGSPSGVVMPPEASNCRLGNEPGTRTFTIRDLRLPMRPSPDAPLPPVGFDIDGLDSTETDLAGCYQPDMPTGVDNAFVRIVDAIGAALPDYYDDYEFLGEHYTPLSDLISLDVVISDWNGRATDRCVVVVLQGATSGRTITPLETRGRLVDGVIDTIAFGADLPVRLEFDLICDGLVECLDSYGIDVDVMIQDVVARLRFSEDMTELVVADAPNNANSTMFGGHVRFTGTDSEAFVTSVRTFFNAIDPDFAPTVADIFAQHLDLDSTPELSACTSVGSGTSADAFSVAILASSVAP